MRKNANLGIRGYSLCAHFYWRLRRGAWGGFQNPVLTGDSVRSLQYLNDIIGVMRVDINLIRSGL